MHIERHVICFNSQTMLFTIMVSYINDRKYSNVCLTVLFGSNDPHLYQIKHIDYRMHTKRQQCFKVRLPMLLICYNHKEPILFKEQLMANCKLQFTFKVLRNIGYILSVQLLVHLLVYPLHLTSLHNALFAQNWYHTIHEGWIF